MVLLAAGILLGLVVLLAVPVDVAFRFERIEAFAGRLTIRWMFGLVQIRLVVPRIRRRPAELPATPERAGERKRRARLRPGVIVAVLRQTAFRRRLVRLGNDLVRAAHVTRLHLRMRVGLGDPAETGQLWGLVGPLSTMARGLRADVRIEPEFIDPVLELEAEGRLLIFPLQLLSLAGAFALSPPSIRAWRTLRSGRA